MIHHNDINGEALMASSTAGAEVAFHGSQLKLQWETRPRQASQRDPAHNRHRNEKQHTQQASKTDRNKGIEDGAANLLKLCSIAAATHACTRSCAALSPGPLKPLWAVRCGRLRHLEVFGLSCVGP